MHAVTIPNIIELTSSLFIDALCYKFTDSPKAAPVLLGSLLIQSASRAFLRWKVQNVEATQIINSNLFSFLTGTHLQSLIHETGHALASRIVFKNSRPTIILVPFKEGRTHYESRELTLFGSRLGQVKAVAFVASAGPAATLLVSSIAMIVGKVVQNRFQRLSSYLIAYGRSDFFAHAGYALSAQFSSNSQRSHDFVLLSKAGVRPLTTAVALVALSIFLEFGMIPKQVQHGLSKLKIKCLTTMLYRLFTRN